MLLRTSLFHFYFLQIKTPTNDPIEEDFDSPYSSKKPEKKEEEKKEPEKKKKEEPEQVWYLHNCFTSS